MANLRKMYMTKFGRPVETVNAAVFVVCTYPSCIRLGIFLLCAYLCLGFLSFHRVLRLNEGKWSSKSLRKYPTYN